MNQSFFPKDVKRHWTGGMALVKMLANEVAADVIQSDRAITVVAANGQTIRYTYLDLQFRSEKQFRHDIRKATDGSN